MSGRDFGMPVGTQYTVDIETCPPGEQYREELRGRITKEKEAKGELIGEQEMNTLIEDAFRATALSGECGCVLCIGVIAEHNGKIIAKRVFGYDKSAKKLTRDESAALSGFWDLLKGFNPHRDLIIGHNIYDFDLLFLYKRSIINQVRPTVDLSFARYRSRPVFDTMREWEKWGRKSIGLGKLAGVLGLQTSKTAEIDGSKVYDHLLAGRDSEIAEYCYRDVVLTRQIYCRMNFINIEEDMLPKAQ